MFPFFIQTMQQTNAIPEMLQQILLETTCYLVSQKVDKSNNYKFFIDNDSNLLLSDCIKINRKLRFMVDESGLYPDGNYSLEISSPGVDEPLLNIRQYTKNINRLVEITFNNAELKPIIGRLKAVTNEHITVIITDKKKKIETEQNINFTDIKQSIVQIEF